MKNPFEAPKQEKPADDFEIDVSDFREYKEDPAFGAGIKDLELQDLEAGHAEAAKDVGAERGRQERQDRAAEAAAEAFFAKKDNAHFMKRFGNDPGALERFKGGLKDMMVKRGVELGYQDPETMELDLDAFRASPKFAMELVKYSFAFEDEEDRRKQSRAA